MLANEARIGLTDGRSVLDGSELSVRFGHTAPISGSIPWRYDWESYPMGHRGPRRRRRFAAAHTVRPRGADVGMRWYHADRPGGVVRADNAAFV